MSNIEERREATLSRLTQLKTERGLAMLNGEKIGHAEIAALEAELAGLDDAEGVAAAQARTQAEARHQARQAQLRDDLAGLESNRLKAHGKAEAACRELKSAVSDVLKVSDAMHKVCT